MEPQKLNLFTEEPSTVPTSVENAGVALEQPHTATESPEKMVFGAEREKKERQAEVLEMLVRKLVSAGKELTPSVAPTADSIGFNSDSSLNKEVTAQKKDNIFNAVVKGLQSVCSEMEHDAHVERELNRMADIEVADPNRKSVYIHFMYDGVCVGDFSGFEGDKLPLPTAEDIDTFFKGTTLPYEPGRFIGWDSSGKAESSKDIVAVLKVKRKITLTYKNRVIGTVETFDGVKTATALTKACEELGLITPLFVNYAVYAPATIVTEDIEVKLTPKTQEATESLAKLVGGERVTVVFALRPSDLKLDTRQMTKEELREALIIQRVDISAGESVSPPSDDVLESKGLRTPFEQYYSWSNSLENIQTSCVIKAVPLSVLEYSENIIQDAQDASLEDWVASGKRAVKAAVNAVKYPALLIMERQLVKNFEAGRKLQTRDFVFMKHRNELMLMKYVGVSSEVEIPARVNGMYVKYVHPKALSNGPFRPWHIFNKNKLFSIDRLGATGDNITRVILPNSLRYVPGYFLHGLHNVDRLVIPSSVGKMSPNALAGSGIEEIYFNGACPQGFEQESTDADVFAHREYYKTFFTGG